MWGDPVFPPAKLLLLSNVSGKELSGSPWVCSGLYDDESCEVGNSKLLFISKHGIVQTSGPVSNWPDFMVASSWCVWHSLPASPVGRMTACLPRFFAAVYPVMHLPRPWFPESGPFSSQLCVYISPAPGVTYEICWLFHLVNVKLLL